MVNPFTDIEEFFLDCCVEGNLDGVKLALENGANISYCNNCSLVDASRNSHFGVVKYLLNKGIAIPVDNQSTDDVFIYASKFGEYDIVAKLINFIFDQQTMVYAYDSAKRNNHNDVAKLLNKHFQFENRM